MEERESPPNIWPPPNTSVQEIQSKDKTENQQLQLESGVVTLPGPSDANHQPATPNPSQVDLFDSWDQDQDPESRPRPFKRKKTSSSPQLSSSDETSKSEEMPEADSISDFGKNEETPGEEDFDSDSENEDSQKKDETEKNKSRKKTTPIGNKQPTDHTKNHGRKNPNNIARVPRRAEFPVVVRDVRGGSATLQGLGPSRREKALANHIGPFQWTMGFRRAGQFMVACKDKHQQTKLANTTFLMLGPGVKMFIECSIPSPHTEGVIKGIPLDEEIPKQAIKVLVDGEEIGDLVTDVQRLKRRDGQLSKALRLKFASETLPEEVIICKSLYRVNAYVANPIRCSRCSSFGHHWKTCVEKEQTCPRCGCTGHDAKSCSGLKYCKNCKVEGHSAAYSGCPYYKQLKKANQIRATTWMPHQEAFKRAGALNTSQENETHENIYLGSKLSLSTYAKVTTGRNLEDSRSLSGTGFQKRKNSAAKSNTIPNSRPSLENDETSLLSDKEADIEYPSLKPHGTQNRSQEKKSEIPSTPKTTGTVIKPSRRKEMDHISAQPQNGNESTMNEILKRLDQIAKRQEKQEEETALLKASQETQAKETASLRDSFEQEKAKRLELEKKFANQNIKALKQQQSDSRKTSALKEIFSFILQSMNSGKTGSAVAGQLDAILSKYMLDDGHQAFIGNQLKAAGEFIGRKDSLTEENISNLTDFLNKKQ